MNNFDDKLKKMAHDEESEIPDIVLSKIDETLNDLPEKKKRVNINSIIKRTLSVAACLIITFIFILPNVSVTYAKSIEKIPVIGKIASMITFRNYTYHDQTHEMNIKEPSIDNSVENAQEINTDVNTLTNKLVSQFYNELDLQSNGYGSIYMDYETITDTDKWFTLKLTIDEIAASSNSYYKYYHIDKVTGEIMTLNDLFINDCYKDLITKEIKSQMKTQMENNENITYWTNEAEFSDSFSSIEDDDNFYWNNDGNLVIVFDKYEVGPGSIGTPEFVIDKKLLKDCLKQEYKNL